MSRRILTRLDRTGLESVTKCLKSVTRLSELSTRPIACEHARTYLDELQKVCSRIGIICLVELHVCKFS